MFRFFLVLFINIKIQRRKKKQVEKVPRGRNISAEDNLI
jgi:hypothetical protein